jgi:PKD repeat protein
VTFDASSSSPEAYNDTITNYFWTFGDGKNASTTSKITTHQFSQIGNYTVTLNVTDLEGLWNTTSKEIMIAVIHDVAIVNIDCLPRIYDEWEVSVKVQVKNEGTYTESFTVDLYANSTLIGSKLITDLDPTATTTLTYVWDTAGLTVLANYSLEATAETLEFEVDTADNTKIFEPVLVSMLGDIIFNRSIDLYDAVKLLTLYGFTTGDPSWDPMVDLYPDGAIDIFDAVALLTRYGTQY